MGRFYEVIITEKATGETIGCHKDVEEVLREENLITGEIVTRITRKDNRTSKYDNSVYDVTVLGK